MSLSARHEYEKRAQADAPPPAPNGKSASEIHCVKCKTPNANTRKFCSQCGDPLWSNCIQCNEVCAASEQFCGHCGANQSELETKLREQIMATLRKAEDLLHEFRFDDAALELAGLRVPKHRRVEDLAERRTALIAEIRAERKRHEDRQEGMIHQAERLFEKDDMPGVVQLLESIPATIRNKQASQLLHDARSRWETVATLKREIRENSKTYSPIELGMKVETLLALVPQDSEVLGWGKQLADHLSRNALRLAKAGKYPEAREFVEQIPLHFRDENTQKLTEHVVELDWMTRELQLAPVADRRLLEIGQRLIKLVPQDESVKKTVERIEQRVVVNGTARRVTWATAPNTTALGVPVEPLFEIGLPIQGGEATLRKAPGSFYVAIGLALQAAGQSVVTTNLMPRKTGLMNKLALPLTRPAKTAWGLDLSNSGLKAVRVGPDKDGKLCILDALHLQHETPLERPDAEKQRATIVHRTLHEFTKDNPIANNEKVALSWSGLRLLGRFVSLPPLKGRRFLEAVKYEVKHQVPFPLDEVVWDYYDPEGAARSEGSPAEIVLFVAKLREVQNYLFPLETAELNIDILQADVVALHNYFHHALHLGRPVEQDGPRDVLAALDVGSDATHIVVSGPSTLWFRSLRLGGDNMSDALARKFQMTFSQAEQLKKAPQQARLISSVDAELGTVYDKILVETKRSLENFLAQHGRHNVSKVLGVGGAFQTAGLWRWLRHGQ